MLFQIKAANRDTGHEAEFIVEADSEEGAVGRASDMGFLVQSTHQMPPIHMPAPPATASTEKASVVPMTRMLVTQILMIVILAVGLGVPLLQTNLQQAQPVQKWEYTLESPSDITFETTLDRLGEEGWALVNARRATSSYGGAKYEMIFRRPKR